MEFPALEDHFELEHEIGRGGFGVVFSARHRPTGDRAAIKIALAPPTPEVLARVHRELRLLTGLRHQNLVGLFGGFTTRGGSLALAYELVDGWPLSQAFAKDAPLIQDVSRWVKEIAAALDCVHNAGLVHRDLKPENVMIDTAGVARLLDFGLARPQDKGETVTQMGLILGTPQFMAPEVFRGQRAEAAADRYALAATAYWLLAGSPPFPGDTPAQIHGSQIAGPPRRVPGLDPGVTTELERLFARALAVRPEERYPTGIQFATALHGALSAPPLEGSPATLDLSGAYTATNPTLVSDASLPLPERQAAPPRRAGQTLRSTTARLSRRWRRPIASLGGVLVLTTALALALTRPRAADISPLPATPTAPAPSEAIPFTIEDFYTVRDQLNNLQGVLIDETGQVYRDRVEAGSSRAFEILDGDPFLRDRVIDQLPALGPILDWWSQDGRPEYLDEELIAQHRKTDNALVAQKQPPMFAPFLDLTPADGDRPLTLKEGDLFKQAAPDVSLPQRIGGWFRVYLDEYANAIKSFEQKDKRIRADPTKGPKALQGAMSATHSLVFDGLGKALIGSRAMRATRTSFQPYISEEVAAAHRAHIALGRSLREEPETAMLLARVYDLLNQQGLNKLFISHLSALPLELLIGPTPGQDPAFAHIQFEILKLQMENIDIAWRHTTRTVATMQRMDTLAALVLDAGNEVSPYLRIRVAGLRIEGLLMLNEIETAVQVFRRFYDLIQIVPKRVAGVDWFQRMGSVALVRNQRSSGWTRAELEAIWAFIKDHDQTPRSLDTPSRLAFASRPDYMERRRFPAKSMDELAERFEALIAAAPRP